MKGDVFTMRHVETELSKVPNYAEGNPCEMNKTYCIEQEAASMEDRETAEECTAPAASEKGSGVW